MQRPLVFLLPGPIETPTGGFVFDRHVIEGCRAVGLNPQVLIAPGAYPRPAQDALDAASRLIEGVEDGTVVVVDGLCLTPLAPALTPHAERLCLVGLIHHPLADETGAAQTLLTQEAEILTQCRRVIATSRTTACRLIAGLGVPEPHISVVQPGVDAAPITEAAHPPRRPGALRLLSVGTLIPRKGHDLLVEALGALSALDWHLDLVGEARDPIFAATLADQISTSDLSERITLHGAVSRDRLEGFYREADLFVLASRHEGFGIAYLEAVRWGLPVIGTTAGAIPEAVPEAARLLVAPDSAEAVRDGLRRLIEDGATRARLRAGAQAAAPNLRTWSEAGDAFSTLMRDLCHE